MGFGLEIETFEHDRLCRGSLSVLHALQNTILSLTAGCITICLSMSLGAREIPILKVGICYQVSPIPVTQIPAFFTKVSHGAKLYCTLLRPSQPNDSYPGKKKPRIHKAFPNVTKVFMILADHGHLCVLDNKNAP